MAWYKAGSITVNAGETSVTGIDVKFASNARVGDGLRGPDGAWYEVVNIASETVLGIYPAYQGPSVSASTDYVIAPIQGYVKSSADRLRDITNQLRDFDEEIAEANEAATRSAASATASKASEDQSLAWATESYNHSQTAEVSNTQAQASAAAALVSQNAAKVSEDASKVSETNSKASETQALAAETLAEAWASNPEDVVVQDGKYSAYHYSRKAESIAGPKLTAIAQSVWEANDLLIATGADSLSTIKTSDIGRRVLTAANENAALTAINAMRNLSAVSIDETSDLNNFTTAGFVNVLIGAYNPNIPVNGQFFYLMVFTWGESVTQLAVPYGETVVEVKTFPLWRSRYQGVWSTWGETATKAHVQEVAATKQNNLGFTPVQQGTGIGQSGSIVKIGYAVDGDVKVTVDAYDFGGIAFKNTLANSATTHADENAAANTLVKRTSGGGIVAGPVFATTIFPSTSIEIGGQAGVASTPIIDFHSGATLADYDSRIIATGGTGVAGGGALTYNADGGHYFQGVVQGNATINATNGCYNNGQLTWSRADFDPTTKVAGQAGSLGLINRVQGGEYINYTGENQSFNAALEVRENGGVATGGTAPNHIYNAPSIAFHWGGNIVHKLMMNSTGNLCWGSVNGQFSEMTPTGNIKGSVFGNDFITNWLAAYYTLKADFANQIANNVTAYGIGGMLLLKNISGVVLGIDSVVSGVNLAYTDAAGVNYGALTTGTYRCLGYTVVGAVNIFIRIA